ncbi:MULTISPECIES: hypothetical protein [unclassified Bradyrhizobium]
MVDCTFDAGVGSTNPDFIVSSFSESIGHGGHQHDGNTVDPAQPETCGSTAHRLARLCVAHRVHRNMITRSAEIHLQLRRRR